MRYIKTIKKIGMLKFLFAVKNELRKEIFAYKEQILNRDNDKNSFSQYSEDLYIDRILNYKSKGVYIDIGANNPLVLSNTKRFYDKGWRGINIEPDRNNFDLFIKERPFDANLNIGVSNNPGDLIFYVFEENTLSTFSKEAAQEGVASGHKILEEKIIKTLKLSDVLSEINFSEIDFMTIDTEGYDQEVLDSNNWNRFRPRLICIEDSSGNNFDLFFKEIGYKKIGFNGLNSFFVKKEIYG